MARQPGQQGLIIQGEATGRIAGEARRGGERRIGGIAVDHPVFLRPGHGIGITLADEGGLLGLLGEGPQLFLREIGLLVRTERHVEAALLVVAAQAVEPVAIQKQEQLGPLKASFGLVELGAQPIIGSLVVVLGHKQLARLVDEVVRLSLEVIVETDQIRIDVVEHIGIVIRVEKH